MRKLSLGKRLLVLFLDAVGYSICLLFRLFTRKPTNGQRRITTILFLELWGIGDLVMATSALSDLRHAFPEARIVLLAKPHAKVLFQEGHLVDEVIPYDFPWTAFSGKYRLWRYKFHELLNLISRLRSERFDLAICARMDIRNNLLMFLAGAKRRVGYNYGGGAYFLTDAVSVDSSRPHRVDEWVRLLEYLGVSATDPRPMLYVSEEERTRSMEKLETWGVKAGDLLIGIHPGARIPVRRWDLQKFATLGDAVSEKYDAKVLVFIDPDGFGADIPMRNRPFCVRPSLREMMAFIQQCHLFICNDSGPMHLAVALGVPVIAVFGPTKKEWFGPYGKVHRIVMQDGFPCRPCFDQCIFDQPYCITTITVEQVLAVVQEQLARVKVSLTAKPGS